MSIFLFNFLFILQIKSVSVCALFIGLKYLWGENLGRFVRKPIIANSQLKINQGFMLVVKKNLSQNWGTN